MSNAQFLRELIRNAAQLWNIDLADISRKGGKTARARYSVAAIAHDYGCSTMDICSAFGWPEHDRNYERPNTTQSVAQYCADNSTFHGNTVRLWAVAAQLMPDVVTSSNLLAEIKKVAGGVIISR